MYIVTRNVNPIKDVTIYGQSISNDLKDTVIGEYNVFQIIIFSSPTVKLRCAFLQILPIKISHNIVNKATGKRPHAFMLVRLIILFDRGRDYYS